jgi:subtilisin family serine protease
MAAAHVSGVAGLVRDARPELKPHAVAAVLKSTADPVDPRLQFGQGIVNAYDAVTQPRSK